jgi:ankyrin repeat protein
MASNDNMRNADNKNLLHEIIWKLFENKDTEQVIEHIRDMDAHVLQTEMIYPLTNRPLLHESAAKGYLDIVSYLIENKKIPVDTKDTCDHLITALHMACREGRLDVARYLLKEALANVNEQDRDRYTPLHYASINGHVPIVELLIAHPGINVNLTDDQRRTALHRAIEKGKSEVAHLLIVKGHADLNIQNNHGWTALHYASYQENRNLCQMLLHHGANTNLKDREGRQPLFWGYGTWHDEKGGCTCPKPH